MRHPGTVVFFSQLTDSTISALRRLCVCVDGVSHLRALCLSCRQMDCTSPSPASPPPTPPASRTLQHIQHGTAAPRSRLPR